MKKKNRILIYPFVIMGMLLLLTNSCEKDKTDEIKYSTNDLTGVWKGDLRVEIFGGDRPGPTQGPMEFTFRDNGTFISMTGPSYVSISSNLTVAEDGKILGIITTTHKTHSGTNTETTSMNWAGSMFETKTKIKVDMNWPWQNTSPGSGYFLITGSLTKQ
ncbi:MAG: hypothetical protein Q7U47_15875 [Paludibacter sp.]|nr:hypothetical protein [Paludibacter sp.]